MVFLKFTLINTLFSFSFLQIVVFATPQNELDDYSEAADHVRCPLLYYHDVKMINPNTLDEITHPSKVGDIVLLKCIEDPNNFHQLNKPHFYEVYPESKNTCQHNGTWSLKTTPTCLNTHHLTTHFNPVSKPGIRYCDHLHCDNVLGDAKKVGDLQTEYRLTNFSCITDEKYEIRNALFTFLTWTCLSFINFKPPYVSSGTPKKYHAEISIDAKDVLTNIDSNILKNHYTAFRERYKHTPSSHATIFNINACTKTLQVRFITFKENMASVWDPAPEFYAIYEQNKYADCPKPPVIAFASFNCTETQVCAITCGEGHGIINNGKGYSSGGTIRCQSGYWEPQPLPICAKVPNSNAINEDVIVKDDELPTLPSGFIEQFSATKHESLKVIFVGLTLSLGIALGISSILIYFTLKRRMRRNFRAQVQEIERRHKDASVRSQCASDSEGYLIPEEMPAAVETTPQSNFLTLGYTDADYYVLPVDSPVRYHSDEAAETGSEIYCEIED